MSKEHGSALKQATEKLCWHAGAPASGQSHVSRIGQEPRITADSTGKRNG